MSWCRLHLLFARVTILRHDHAIESDEVLALHTKSTCCYSKSLTNMIKTIDDRCRGSPNEGESTIMQGSVSYEFDDSCISHDRSIE